MSKVDDAMNQTTIDEAYRRLDSAYTNKQSIAPLTRTFPNLDIHEAYQVQLKTIQNWESHGETIVGKKIGLTSLAMQQLLGVDQPDYGHLLKSMEEIEETPVSLDALFQPKAEGEIAFVLKKDLKGPNVTTADVMEATDYIAPAIEIVDSRIKDWEITLPDTIADNASCGRYVLGKKKLELTQEIDLAEIEMNLYKNGMLINEGSGKDVLGNPATCVAWLANALSEHGIGLHAGEVILSGALSAAVEVGNDDTIHCAFSTLGTVEATFKA